ncbi:unnamed protein product [Ascophyllum nodosum]
MPFRALVEQKTQLSKLASFLKTMVNPPQMPKRTSVVLGVVNCFLPGVGTMVIGAITYRIETLLVGALQLFTTVVLIGWAWSIMWGVELMRRSFRRGATAEDFDGPSHFSETWTGAVYQGPDALVRCEESETPTSRRKRSSECP